MPVIFMRGCRCPQETYALRTGIVLTHGALHNALLIVVTHALLPTSLVEYFRSNGRSFRPPAFQLS